MQLRGASPGIGSNVLREASPRNGVCALATCCLRTSRAWHLYGRCHGRFSEVWDQSREGERTERYTSFDCVVAVAVYLQWEWSVVEVDLPCIHHVIGVAAVGVSNRNCDATLR